MQKSNTIYMFIKLQLKSVELHLVELAWIDRGYNKSRVPPKLPPQNDIN